MLWRGGLHATQLEVFGNRTADGRVSPSKIPRWLTSREPLERGGHTAETLPALGVFAVRYIHLFVVFILGAFACAT